MRLYRRGKIWWFDAKVAGYDKPVRRSTKEENRPAAHFVATDMVRQLVAEAAHRDTTGSFDDAVERYLREYAPVALESTTVRRYKISIRHFQDFLNELGIDQIGGITKDVVRSYAAWRFDRADEEGRYLTPATVRRDLAAISSLLTLAVEEWGLAEFNILKTFSKRMLPESDPRTRFLSHDEEQQLLRHTPEYLTPIISLAVDTGLRLTELCTRQWKHCDLERRTIFVDKTKNNQARTVPLLPRSVQILTQLQRRSHSVSRHEFILLNPQTGERYKQFTRGLKGAASRADIDNLRWHDLRRTCGCRLLQDHKLSLHQVSKWLGHKSIKVTERSYAFMLEDALLEAVYGKPADVPVLCD